MPVVASLADDIADIYRDLKKGFALLGSRDGAVWEWRHGFEHHWAATPRTLYTRCMS
jgi:hypothetical protein